MRTWDAAGNLLIDFGDYLGRILGATNTGRFDGAVTGLDFSTGTPFFVMLPIDTGYAARTPVVTMGSGSISWAWRVSGASYNSPCFLVYGVR